MVLFFLKSEILHVVHLSAVIESAHKVSRSWLIFARQAMHLFSEIIKMAIAFSIMLQLLCFWRGGKASIGGNVPKIGTDFLTLCWNSLSYFGLPSFRQLCLILCFSAPCPFPAAGFDILFTAQLGYFVVVHKGNQSAGKLFGCKKNQPFCLNFPKIQTHTFLYFLQN